MKYLFMIAVTFLNLPAMAGCIFQIEHGESYCISILKHVENRDDTLKVQNYKDSELNEITGIISQYKMVKISFNKGVFMALVYDNLIIKRWAALSPGEKDMIGFIEQHWNIKE